MFTGGWIASSPRCLDCISATTPDQVKTVEMRKKWRKPTYQNKSFTFFSLGYSMSNIIYRCFLLCFFNAFFLDNKIAFLASGLGDIKWHDYQLFNQDQLPMITTKYQKHQIHSEPLILCGYFRHSCFFPKLLQKDGEILSSFCSGNK